MHALRRLLPVALLLACTTGFARITSYNVRYTKLLRGKVVLVGLSEVLLAGRKDSFYTVFALPNGKCIGGVEIAATAFLNFLKNS